MVTLSKIYTKTGDKGTTGLGDGSRRPKHDLRVAAYGEVDEANAAIGLLICALNSNQEDSNQDQAISDLLQMVQNDLFDLGGDLCVPQDTTTRTNPLRVTESQVLRLESQIDQYNAALQPLTSFILPGGSLAASHAHLARTITRRAERAMTLLASHEAINPHAMLYINRLSDLLFVLARVLNGSIKGRADGGTEILWQPAKHR
ncbi:MAG: cob(I)yrinic acid a,c-diamide adenosyltransferase [Alphaproteobacteria bacterium]